MDGSSNQDGIWFASGGSGSRLVLLLHGLGANASVWHGIIPILERRGYRWLAPDLRGHGSSVSTGPFGYGNHAADISNLIKEERPADITVLGHSFGGVVGALLCSGLFGASPSKLVAVGIKLDWSDQDVADARGLAERPSKTFPTHDEAMDRYLRVSGLSGLASASGPFVERGVVSLGEGYALAMNPKVFSAVGPSISAILRAVIVPFRLAAGTEDTMVTSAAMLRHDPSAVTLDGLAHNAHVQDSEVVAAIVE